MPGLAVDQKVSLEYASPARFRTLFISDVHLAMRNCRASELVSFLQSHDAPLIYLVGDVVDFWRMRRGGKWRPSHTQVIQELIVKARRGSKIVYIPGNHDHELRAFAGTKAGNIEIRLRDLHLSLSGRKYLVIHGDEFDVVVSRARWLAVLGDIGYDLALAGNPFINAVRRLFGLPYWSLSAYLKNRVKRAVNSIGNFEALLAAEALRVGTQGVICGHIHHAAMQNINGVEYINTGDWVESCTAVGEHLDGRFEIIRWTGDAKANLITPKAEAASPAL